MRENKTYMLTSELQTGGAKWGMNTLDEHLMKLYKNDIISYGDLMVKAQDPEFISKNVKKK